MKSIADIMQICYKPRFAEESKLEVLTIRFMQFRIGSIYSTLSEILYTYMPINILQTKGIWGAVQEQITDFADRYRFCASPTPCGHTPGSRWKPGHLQAHWVYKLLPSLPTPVTLWEAAVSLLLPGIRGEEHTHLITTLLICCAPLLLKLRHCSNCSNGEMLQLSRELFQL